MCSLQGEQGRRHGDKKEKRMGHVAILRDEYGSMKKVILIWKIFMSKATGMFRNGRKGMEK